MTNSTNLQVVSVRTVMVQHSAAALQASPTGRKAHRIHSGLVAAHG